MSAPRRLVVDWAACDAHGLCAAWAPELIGRDEWGYPVPAGGDIPQELLGQARAAVRSCPALALQLHRSPQDRGAPTPPSGGADPPRSRAVAPQESPRKGRKRP